MGLPTFGVMYVRDNGRAGATLHQTLSCEAIVNIVKRSAPGSDDPEWQYDSSMVDGMFAEIEIGSDLTEWDAQAAQPRRFCRVCTIEHVMSLALQRYDNEPVSAMTISPWPAIPPNRKLREPPRASERAAERMPRIAAAIGGFTVPISRENGTVLVADVPERARALVDRNFWAVEPPARVAKNPDVISSAWSLILSALSAADPMSDEDIWAMAEAAHQTY